MNIRHRRHIRSLIRGFGILLMLLPLSSDAAPKVIEMLNRQNDEMMVFSIPLLQVESGETVTFKATDLTHSVAFIDGGVPTDVPPLKGVFNTDTSYTFEKPGIYVYKCPAHYGMGMIGAVVVDRNHHNLAAIKSLELMPAAQKRLSQILSQLTKVTDITQPPTPTKATK